MVKVLIETPEGLEKTIDMDVGEEIQPLNTIQSIYDILLKIFTKWMDMEVGELKIVTLWTLGAFFHQCFETYPYLFFNAMRASGKSRLLKLIAFLLDGTYTVNMTEAVLFRKNDPLMLDEAENLRGKEKANLRELLNIAYKKGAVVERARKNPKTEAFEIDKFNVYRPISMANINGLDDVLESRCIMLKLDRSYNKKITRRVEAFERDEDIINFKIAMRTFISLQGENDVTTARGRDSVVGQFAFLYTYNTLIDVLNNNLSTNITVKTVNTDKKWSITAVSMVERLEKSDLVGRDFELWLPLFLIAQMIGTDVFEESVRYADILAKERAETDLLQNTDVGFIAFLEDYIDGKVVGEFTSISDLVGSYMMGNPSDKWFTSEWVGWALRRNNLVIQKRRHGGSREVLLDFNKIHEKAKKLGIDVKETVKEVPSIIDNYIGED